MDTRPNRGGGLGQVMPDSYRLKPNGGHLRMRIGRAPPENRHEALLSGVSPTRVRN